jgi:TRAP-type C4-dicarboxylate transport system permease small subunit
MDNQDKSERKPLIEKFVNVEMYIAMLALFVVVVVNFVEIVLRATIGNSFLWIQEFSVLMMLWMIFMGFVKIAYINKDVYIDYLVTRLPEKLSEKVTFFATILILIFLVIMSIYSSRLWYAQMGVVTIVARIPQVLNTTPVCLCFYSLIWVYLDKLIKLFQHASNNKRR